MWFITGPDLKRRLQAHHKRVQSLSVNSVLQNIDTRNFLASLLPQLTSYDAQFGQISPKMPPCPLHELSQLSRTKLRSLALSLASNYNVDAGGTMNVLDWLRIGLPNLNHLDIKILMCGKVKDTLETVLECCSSLQSLRIFVDPPSFVPAEFGPGQLLSLLSSICLKNAKTLQKVFFRSIKLSECAVEALGFKDGSRAFNEWNERCKELFGVHLSNLILGVSSERVWDYALTHTKGSPRYADFDQLFELCYETLTDKIYAIREKVMRKDDYQRIAGFPEYFIAKIQNWLPELVASPTDNRIETVAALSVHSPDLYDALKSMLISAGGGFSAPIPASIIIQLVRDAPWVHLMGPTIARITDDPFYGNLKALTEAPKILLTLLKAAGLGIFSCARPHNETLAFVVQEYNPATRQGRGLREVIKHILELHQAHPDHNHRLEVFLREWNLKPIKKLLGDEELCSILLAIFAGNEGVKNRIRKWLDEEK
jgi:hypothetical protein